jgi:hypothetical protein
MHVVSERMYELNQTNSAESAQGSNSAIQNLLHLSANLSSCMQVIQGVMVY